jgi:predicted CXXCH cytochrome family protein
MSTAKTPYIGIFGFILILFAWGLGGCDNSEKIFVERPFYEDPQEAALGFLGFDEEEDKLTVCGNCHVGQQSEWQGTAHGDAWETLQASGHAAEYCENCHTVGPNGNTTTDGGWQATKESRYHDVQCESCHGPGQAHVSNPDASQPIASIAVGDLTNLDNATSCAQCHQGTHHPFAEEWAQSGHGTVVAFAAGREECAGCHRGQGILKAWGVDDNYLEKDSDELLPITCAVCHDPHDARNEGQLRFSVNTTSLEENLCARCHDRRTVPDPNSSHGLEPHAPQAALLLGEAGWFPPNVNIDQGQIVGTHGSMANQRLCATCHVNRFEVTDEATGEFVFQVTGHLFTALPCVDAQGIPTPGPCEVTQEARSFSGCTTSGCHGNEGAAFSALTAAMARIERIANELYEALMIVDPNGEEEGGEIDPRNPIFTVAEGALFNYHLSQFGDDVISASVHNPFLIESLLIASLQAVEDTYGVSTSASKNLEADLQAVLERVPDVQRIVRRGGRIEALRNP